MPLKGCRVIGWRHVSCPPFSPKLHVPNPEPVWSAVRIQSPAILCTPGSSCLVYEAGRNSNSNTMAARNHASKLMTTIETRITNNIIMRSVSGNRSRHCRRSHRHGWRGRSPLPLGEAEEANEEEEEEEERIGVGGGGADRSSSPRSCYSYSRMITMIMRRQEHCQSFCDVEQTAFVEE